MNVKCSVYKMIAESRGSDPSVTIRVYQRDLVINMAGISPGSKIYYTKGSDTVSSIDTYVPTARTIVRVSGMLVEFDSGQFDVIDSNLLDYGWELVIEKRLKSINGMSEQEAVAAIAESGDLYMAGSELYYGTSPVDVMSLVFDESGGPK